MIWKGEHLSIELGGLLSARQSTNQAMKSKELSVYL